MDHAVPVILYFGFALLVAVIGGRVLTRLLERFPVRKSNRISRLLFKSLNSSKDTPNNISPESVPGNSFSRALQDLGLLPAAELEERGTGTAHPANSWKDIWKLRLHKSVPILLCLGMVLMPFFHYWAVMIAAYALVIAATLIGLLLGEASAGSKWIWIPLVAITLSGLIFSPLPSQSPTGLLLVWLLGIYLVSNKLGNQVTRYFGLASIIGSISVIACAIISGFTWKGGMYSPTNYNIAAAAIMVGLLMWDDRRKWALSALVLVALFFTGADEALAAVAVLALTLLLRKDWSKRLLLPVGALAATLLVCTPLGITQTLWNQTPTRIEAGVSGIGAGVSGEEAPVESSLNIATHNRWSVYQEAFQDLKFYGHGYDPFDYFWESVHNIPLRIGYELGIPAAIAWIVSLIYAIRKSKAKYALVAMGVFALFDHMFWTQIPAYYWVALALVSSAAPDLIFRNIRR